MLSSRGNDIPEDPITRRDLDGLTVNAALQKLLSHIRSKAPLPEDDTCTANPRIAAQDLTEKERKDYIVRRDLKQPHG